MDKLYSLLAILGLVLLPSCASVGAVIEGGKDFTTGVIDSSVKGVATVSTAAKVSSGVIETASEEIDNQTDELQEDTPKKK